MPVFQWLDFCCFLMLGAEEKVKTFIVSERVSQERQLEEPAARMKGRHQSYCVLWRLMKHSPVSFLLLKNLQKRARKFSDHLTHLVNLEPCGCPGLESRVKPSR